MSLATLYDDPTLLEVYARSAVLGALVCLLLTAAWWILHRIVRPRGIKAKIGLGFQYLLASAIGLMALAIILRFGVTRQEREMLRQIWKESHAPAPPTSKETNERLSPAPEAPK